MDISEIFGILTLKLGKMNPFWLPWFSPTRWEVYRTCENIRVDVKVNITMTVLPSNKVHSWNLLHVFFGDLRRVDPEFLFFKFLPGTLNNKVLYGCFNWMIQNLYMGNGCFTKHPFINGCLEFQVYVNKNGQLEGISIMDLRISLNNS